MSFISGRKAKAGTNTAGAPDVERRGARGRLERLPTLDAENRDDFLTGFRNWRGSAVLQAAKKRADAIVQANGLNPKKERPLDQVLEMLEDDHIIGTEALLRI